MPSNFPASEVSESTASTALPKDDHAKATDSPATDAPVRDEDHSEPNTEQETSVKVASNGRKNTG